MSTDRQPPFGRKPPIASIGKTADPPLHVVPDRAQEYSAAQLSQWAKELDVASDATKVEGASPKYLSELPRTVLFSCRRLTRKETGHASPGRPVYVFEARLAGLAPLRVSFGEARGRSAARALARAIAHFERRGASVGTVEVDFATWTYSREFLSECWHLGLNVTHRRPRSWQAGQVDFCSPEVRWE